MSETAVRALTLDGIHSAAAPVLDGLRADSAARDAERRHVGTELRALVGAGVLLVRVHPENGGVGGSYRDLVGLIVDVAEADSNVAQALRPSWLVADSLARPTATLGERRLRARVLNGDLFSGTRNEVGVPSGAVTSRLHRSGDGHRLDGAKFYSTGGLHADWFSGTATTDDGEVVSVTVPTRRAGVETVDDYDGIGQRLTASGTTRFTDVWVDDDEIARMDTTAAPTWNPLAQLHLAATEAGIAQAVLRDAVAFTRDVARPIKHSTSGTASGDPYVARTIGEISSRAFVARSVVLAAADALDDAAATAARPELVAATIAVAEAQVAAVRAALEAAELLFGVGSGSATLRSHGLDRHWRNARTVANHNPVDWKSAAVGAFRLTGAEPPTSGLF